MLHRYYKKISKTLQFVVKVSFFDKIKDVTYINSTEQFLQRGSNKIFSASIVKISTLSKDVLDSEWALTTGAVRLVCTWHQIRICASQMTNPKSVNDYFILTRQGWFLLMATDGWPDRLIACNLFPVQLFQNCWHFSEISSVTQGIRSVAGIFMGWHSDR